MTDTDDAECRKESTRIPGDELLNYLPVFEAGEGRPDNIHFAVCRRNSEESVVMTPVAVPPHRSPVPFDDDLVDRRLEAGKAERVEMIDALNAVRSSPSSSGVPLRR